MNRDDAQHEATRRNDELAAGSRYRWFARATGDDEYKLVKVAGLAGLLGGPMKTTTEAKPTPSPQDDPRTPHDRNTGGPWIGI